MNRRKRLAFILLLWMVFVFLLGEIVATGLARERIVELVDVMGGQALVDEWGGFLTTIWLALAVIVPLILIFHWRGRGGVSSFLRKLTPSGRANDRNRAGLAFFHKGGYAAAITEFTEALRLNPRLGDALVNRGVSYFQ